MVSSTSDNARAPRAFAHSGFVLYWWGRLLLVFAIQVVSVAVAWQIYDRTGNPLHLGLVGLVQFLPSLALVLVTGTAADRYNRRHIMALCTAVETACAIGLLGLTLSGSLPVWPVFAILMLFGAARAFMAPAMQSLVANLVPQEALGNAIVWNTSAFHIATIMGPIVGGLAYDVAPEAAYSLAIVLFAIAMALALLIPRLPQKTVPEPATWTTVVAGFRFIWSQPVVLGAISLDLFAVLLGGATALLPVYARDILQTGPWGLGLLRASFGIGALLMSVWLLRYPLRDWAGATMFAAVAIFGVFTVVFGASTLIWLSAAALAIAGAADMISVFIRQTLVQLATPDEVRGRVSAANMLFIGASNELGEFRAGTMAAFIGAVPAVVLGGAGAILIAGVWAWRFPELLRTRSLSGKSARTRP